MIARARNWRAHLHAWSASVLGQPFAWGRTDCGTLARDALAVMFGQDVVPFVPRWHSAREAVAVLQAYGSVPEILARLGAPQTTLSFMRAGDLILSKSDDDESRIGLAVCVDGRRCIASQPAGVARVLLSRDEPAVVCVYSIWEVPDGR